MIQGMVSQARLIWQNKRLLGASTRYEIRKRYADSVLGLGWAVLQPLLFLGLYVFLYMVVFKMRFAGFSEFDYVAYVLTGLVPYLALMEVATASCRSIRDNKHLARNVVMPIDVIPVRTVMVALVSQLIGLAILVVLFLATGKLPPAVVALPLVLAAQTLFLVGLALLLAALGAVLADIGHTIGLLMLFLLFVSPIAFKPDMVPATLQVLLWVNPVHYMTDAFRWVLLDDHLSTTGLWVLPLMALGALAAGTAVFGLLKEAVIDHV